MKQKMEDFFVLMMKNMRNFDVWMFGRKVVNNQETDSTRIENKEYEQQES